MFFHQTRSFGRSVVSVGRARGRETRVDRVRRSVDGVRRSVDGVDRVDDASSTASFIHSFIDSD